MSRKRVLCTKGSIEEHVEVKGVRGQDLRIDGIVQGPISLDGHDLIVGSAAQLHSEIHAGEVVVCGKLVGNVCAALHLNSTIS